MAIKRKKVKAVRLFPILYNISDFVQNDHPSLHPDTLAYQNYWEEVERKCIEGMWGKDFDKESGLGGYRFMPPCLYYYINCCIIAQQDNNNSVIVNFPLLRDIEWIFATSWLTARGFSGFDQDEEFTCHRVVQKIELGVELTEEEERRRKLIDDRLRKPDGSYKTYVDARDYLSQTHPKPLGLPYYDNLAKNVFCLSTRGGGKSYFAANAVIGHEFTFFGKKRFDSKYLINPSPIEVFVGAAKATFSSDLLAKFSATRDYQRDVLGAHGSGDDFIPGYFYQQTRGTLSPNNKAKRPFEHWFNYEEGGVWKEGGSKTKLFHGIYTTENPQAAVGTRPTVMVIEEVGLLGNLLEVQASNEACQIRDWKFGSSYYIGTSGHIEKILESKIIFENPEPNNFLGYKDQWENRPNPIGLFIPGYYTKSIFKDKHGNTDLEPALADIMHEREKRSKSANSTSLDGYIMSYPIVPSEMFLSSNANVFPTSKLREQLIKTEIGDLFSILGTQGNLVWANGERKSVVWENNTNRRRKTIVELNLDSYQEDIRGNIVLYEAPPDYLPAPTYYGNLYKIVYDPVKDDGGGTSLASIIVYKGFSSDSWEGGLQNTIVAEYIGRHDQVKDIHEIAIKLAHYYNAKVMVENNIPDFIRYCRMKGYVHILQYSPYMAISKAVKNQSKKYEYGINMSSKILKSHCEQLLRSLLLDVWKTDHKENKLLFLNQIHSLRILNELISYDGEKNMDHVSSLFLLALWLSQERLEPVEKEKNKKDEDKIDLFFKNRKKSRNKANPFYNY